MTTVKDICGNYQYADRELCERWNNNIPLSELDKGYIDDILMDDSQELDSLCEMFSFLPRSDITAAIVTVVDGDYGEVYITESSRPYSLASAIYHPLDYYIKQ